MIIDSHCHLEYEPMSLALNDTISRANKDGVKFLLTISTTDESLKKIIKITSDYSCVYGTYGIHPHEAKNYKNITSNEIISKINQSKKIIGIGETGLDLYYNHSEKKDQIKSFEEHIIAAQISNLPLIIHTRSAEIETFEILKEIEENQKSDYNTIYDCLALCGIIEFAKHDEQKNDFIDCVSAFSEIIDTGNRINTTGATF